MDKVPATRRRHSAELKTRILAACAEPGASVARIAMENGLNANLVFKLLAPK
jgi:transposase